jgi:SAM-dependent methyltransferase
VKCEATEQNDLETALSRLPVEEDFTTRLLRRMRPFFPLEPPARVLDVGAAQGISLICFTRKGFEAEGVEPWEPAIEVGRELSRRTSIETHIVHGFAESLPFEGQSFDFVQAYSVMEHVDDPEKVFGEVHRVLKSGGGFFFATTSALCPRQVEIAGFPLFPWYPPPLQRAIMDWARRRRPWLVGHTTRPAYHWFKHRKVRRQLREAGFTRLIDRWQLRRGESEGMRGMIINACAANRVARFAGDLVQPGVEYLAIRE